MFINEPEGGDKESNTFKSLDSLTKMISTFRKLQLSDSIDEFVENNLFDLQLFEALDIGVYIIDYNVGNYVYANEALARLIGIKKGEIINSHISTLSNYIHPSDYDSLMSVLIKAGTSIKKLRPDDRKGVNFKTFYRIKKADMSYCWCMQSNKILEDQSTGSSIDIGTVTCLPDHHAVDRVAGYLKIGNKTTEILPGVEEEDPLKALSQRQREVLNMVGKGFNSREISEKLGLSEETIKIHRKKILKKLKVNSSIQAIRILQRYG
ncbi:MAG: LuxR C-terminal-related transcriptional regulator [Bacteroidia bacterium]